MPLAIIAAPFAFLLIFVPGVRVVAGWLLSILGGTGLMTSVLLTAKLFGAPARLVESEWDGVGDWQV